MNKSQIVQALAMTSMTHQEFASNKAAKKPINTKGPYAPKITNKQLKARKKAKAARRAK